MTPANDYERLVSDMAIFARSDLLITAQWCKWSASQLLLDGNDCRVQI